ncbi:RNA ligase [Streptomyces phage Muntaha]|uniref:RNA ligase n=1 Tax=Streptomyces phage Muntaha TaxID=2713269 RepID=A0A6G8R3D4_9CAUD|nr:RNA ligase [Streptomyces phage Muntaha]QIN94704.1 RNA ligase [Streptomyces phage Muntaha]
MVHVSEIFSTDDLEQAIENGYVRVNPHPTAPLAILGYTEKAQFDRMWNDVTLNCRGLIIDHDGFVVARPWKKFFNFGERPLMFDTDAPVEVTDKKDGSLGILYRDPVTGDYAISTRGSFTSDQAIHATELFNKKYSHIVTPFKETTFLFEIVYPKNRIVLNYGDMDDLILLGAVDNERGYYWGPRQAAGIMGWPGPVTEVFRYRSLNECFGVHRENAEGLVIRSGSDMVKLKQADYVELHRIVTNLNERSVWSQLKDGKAAYQICELIPDEWHEWVVDVAQALWTEYSSLENKVLGTYADLIGELPGGFTRKQFAMKATKTPYAGYLFALLDCKSISDMLWEAVKTEVNNK